MSNVEKTLRLRLFPWKFPRKTLENLSMFLMRIKTMKKKLLKQLNGKFSRFVCFSFSNVWDKMFPFFLHSQLANNHDLNSNFSLMFFSPPCQWRRKSHHCVIYMKTSLHLRNNCLFTYPNSDTSSTDMINGLNRTVQIVIKWTSK